MKEHTDGQEEGLPARQDGRRQEAQVGPAEGPPRASPPARRACLVCTYGTLRGATKDEKIGRAIREMAKRGFVNCTLSPAAASFMPLDSSCAKFAPVPADAAAARMEWATNIDRRTAP